MRIDWETVGRIIKRVGDELLPADRLNDLFEISLDEVAWRKGHRYLTLVGDHRQGAVVWGTEGKGQPPPMSSLTCSTPRPRVARAGGAGVIGAGGGAWSRSARARPSPAGEGIPGAWISARQRARPTPVRARFPADAVSMDMTGGYAKCVREHAPQATIVIDNYHVVALATKALDEVRREHWNELR